MRACTSGMPWRFLIVDVDFSSNCKPSRRRFLYACRRLREKRLTSRDQSSVRTWPWRLTSINVHSDQLENLIQCPYWPIVGGLSIAGLNVPAGARNALRKLKEQGKTNYVKHIETSSSECIREVMAGAGLPSLISLQISTNAVEESIREDFKSIKFLSAVGCARSTFELFKGRMLSRLNIDDNSLPVLSEMRLSADQLEIFSPSTENIEYFVANNTECELVLPNATPPVICTIANTSLPVIKLRHSADYSNDLDAVREVLTSRSFSSLQNWSLDGVPNAGSALKNSDLANMQKLTTLSLNRANVTSQQLNKIKFGDRIRRLFLRDNNLSEVPIDGLPTTLTHLDLSDNPIGDYGFSEILKRLRDLDLRTLKLSNCGLTARSIELLTTSPIAAKLQSLHVNGKPLVECGVPIIAQSPISRQIEKLDLGNTDAGNDGWQAIFQPNSFPKLSFLSFARNQLTAVDLKSKSKTAAQPRIWSLNLNDNNLEVDSFLRFIESRSANSLAKLSLLRSGVKMRELARHEAIRSIVELACD